MSAQSLLASLGLAGGLALVALGAASVLGGRSRPRGALAFGLFAMVWGTQIAIANVADMTANEATYRALILVELALLIALPFFLVEFVAAQLPTRLAWVTIWRALTITLALVSSAVFVLDPGALFTGIAQGEGFFPVWGPLHVILVTMPFFVTFGLALIALAIARARSPTPRTRERTSILLAGLGIYAAFAASNNLAFFAWVLGGGFDITAAGFTIIFAFLTAAVAFVAWTIAADIPHGAPSREMRGDRILVAALLIPLVWGGIEGVVVQAFDFPRFETVGLWRLVGMILLAYGIARWRSYDLPQRVRRAAVDATGAGAALATGAAAFGAGTLASSGPAVPILAGVVVLGAAFVPSLRFARRIFGVERAPRSDLERSLYGQRIDSYRAALEASLARGTFDEDQSFLAALRERFQISADEDRLLVHLAQSSVLVARDARAWEAYERLRLLGEGGGGRTWLARDRSRDRLVVLKEPLERWQQDPAGRELVLREARLAAKVRHANVVAVEEVVEGKGSPVMVMEYMEGGSLRDLLRSKGTLSWPEARAIALDMLSGLEAVHAAGIVHRDVKPNNILLDGDGVAKVADFGIAVTPASASERTMLIDPANSTIAGTMSYMAPESRQGAAPDRRADVYSAAAVIHEMLYGAPPGLPSPTVIRQDLPAALPAALTAALRADPQQRTGSARALAEEIARL